MTAPAHARAPRPVAPAPGTPVATSPSAFSLVDASLGQESQDEGSVFGVHPFGLGRLTAASASMLATILLIAGGALLIALMCFDAVGVGPRHTYLRRRTVRWWLPWR